MSLWKIAWRSIQHRRLASSLTALSIGLGVALVVTVLVIHAVLDTSFRRNAQGYDLIVGAKGSALELVLNTVYYLRRPGDNIPYHYYEELREGDYSSEVEVAIPVCMGGYYAGFPVVATIPDMFEELEYLDGKRYTFAQGRNFDVQQPFESVIGATVARKAALRVGDTFRPAHGIKGEQPHDESFTVVGILEPTGTPNDRALFVNIHGFWAIHENPAKAGHGTAGQPADEKQLTAVLVRRDWSNASRAVALPMLLNENKDIQGVAPAEVIAELFEGIVGNVQLVLLILAVLVIVVAGIGLMVSMYNSMSERRHEIAVMRALGAQRGTVMSIILLESILLSLGGGLIGVVLGHGLIGALSGLIVEQTGVTVSALSFQAVELVLIPGLIGLASLVGYLPAVVAYRTDVAQSLVAAP